MSIRRFRRIHLLAVPAAFIALGLIAEAAYTRTARDELERLVEGVRRAHPPGSVHIDEIKRFREPVTKYRPSLIEDAWEAMLFRMEARGPLIRSRLRIEDDTTGATIGCNAYASVWLELRQPGIPAGFHGFIWSPRRREFVRIAWDECRREGCPAYGPRYPDGVPWE